VNDMTRRGTRRTFYEAVIRPSLFKLSPDTSHALARHALAWPAVWHVLEAIRSSQLDPAMATSFAGVKLASPIGLGAGLDKDADFLESLSCFGFGFLTIGSIMPKPRQGNPYPRLVRYPDTQSMADSMGVPSKGLDYAAAHLASFFPARKVPVFANIGGFDPTSIAASFVRLAPHVDAVEISLMCPNVPQARETFDDLELLRDVLDLIDVRTSPVVLRVPNDTTTNLDHFAEFVETCVKYRVDGLKIGGGRSIQEPRLGSGNGTLHGRAIFERAIENVRNAVRFAHGRIDIKGNGGISTADDVKMMLDAGCRCVDLYSALIYKGWSVARSLAKDLSGQIGTAMASNGAEQFTRSTRF
jgi:dihydroorotate dehydrogenase